MASILFMVQEIWVWKGYNISDLAGNGVLVAEAIENMHTG